MSDIKLAIESFHLAGFDGDEGAVRAKLEQALSLLASRLAKSPLARMGSKQIALSELELGELSSEDLVSPSGAEKLADALYRALERNIA